MGMYVTERTAVLNIDRLCCSTYALFKPLSGCTKSVLERSTDPIYVQQDLIDTTLNRA